jgi:hypothetical protein
LTRDGSDAARVSASAEGLSADGSSLDARDSARRLVASTSRWKRIQLPTAANAAIPVKIATLARIRYLELD